MPGNARWFLKLAQIFEFASSNIREFSLSVKSFIFKTIFLE